LGALKDILQHKIGQYKGMKRKMQKKTKQNKTKQNKTRKVCENALPVHNWNQPSKPNQGRTRKASETFSF